MIALLKITKSKSSSLKAEERLYKEWFIDLRFPGHENVEIVDGVPEGWQYKKVSSFGSVITGKTPSTAKSQYYGGEVPFY